MDVTVGDRAYTGKRYILLNLGKSTHKSRRRYDISLGSLLTNLDIDMLYLWEVYSQI